MITSTVYQLSDRGRAQVLWARNRQIIKKKSFSLLHNYTLITCSNLALFFRPIKYKQTLVDILYLK